MRRLPLEHDGSRLDVRLRLEPLQSQRIDPAAQQANRGPVFGLVAGLDPRIDQGCLVVVDPQSHAVFRVHTELVVPRVVRQQASLPLHGELLVADLLRLGAALAKLEINPRIGSLECFLVVAEITGRVVVAREAALFANSRFSEKRAGQIGHRVGILPHGQAGQLDTRRSVSGPGLGRVEGLENVLGHPLRILVRALLGIVLRHRVVDQHGQVLERALALQWFRVTVFHAFAVSAVTCGALARRSPGLSRGLPRPTPARCTEAQPRRVNSHRPRGPRNRAHAATGAARAAMMTSQREGDAERLG